MKRIYVFAGLAAFGLGVIGCDNNDGASLNEPGRPAETSRASEQTPANQAAVDAQQAGSRDSGTDLSGTDSTGSGTAGQPGSSGVGTGATGANTTGVSPSSPAPTGGITGTNNARNPQAQGTASQPTTRAGTPR